MWPPRRKIKTARQSEDVKVFRAAVATRLKLLGWSWDEIERLFSDAGYAASNATLRRNVSHIERGEPPFSPSKSSGRPNKVSIEQWQILCGALLFEPKNTDLQWVLTFVKDNFDVTIDYSTASRHLHAMGMSFRLTGDRTMPAGTTDLEYVQDYHAFVLKLRNEEFFKYDSKKILCIDFVTNSRRLERTKTIALKGSKQKKMSDTAPKYTNSYLVAVTKEGSDDFPALMFTYDPTFNPDGRRAAEVKEWCDFYGIERDRIYYLKSDALYCKESLDQVAEFKNRYRSRLRGCRILHDAGNSFMRNGVDILEEEADRVEIFPSLSHGELSVLDNRLFAVAKNQWRSERGSGDMSRQDLYLLWCIDWAKAQAIRHYWTNNFLTRVKKITVEACAKRLKHSNGRSNELIKKEELYLESYAAWRHGIRKTIQDSEMARLESNLDGSYWE